MSVIKSIAAGVLFAVVYTIGYCLAAMSMTGGGHGNWIVMAPVHGSWLVNFVALLLLPLTRHKTARYLFVAALAVYYVWLFLIVRDAYIESFTDKKMLVHVGAVVFPACWLLAGQLVMWAVFVKKIKEARPLD